MFFLQLEKHIKYILNTFITHKFTNKHKNINKSLLSSHPVKYNKTQLNIKYIINKT